MTGEIGHNSGARGGSATVTAIVPDTGEVIALDRGLGLPGRKTLVSLELPEGLSYERWAELGEMLQATERSIMWWLGDWLRYGEKRYGETYAQAVDTTGKSYQTVANAKLVAERIPFSRRRENLSWSHHAEVAALREPGQADRLLDLAEQEGWTRKELRSRVSQTKNIARVMAVEADDGTCKVGDLFKLVASGKRFGTIYADPPWRYDNQGTRAATRNHYSAENDEDGRETQPAAGMSVDEICALPVKDLVAEDGHLHLWTTNAFLFECPKIFDAWGFEFRSSFAWVKPQMGIGNYWRNSHELMLTAIRGNAKRFNDRSLKSWLERDRGAHSAKPEEIRSYIERASVGPFLELFGRRVAPGWAVWGNQIERTMFDHAVAEVA